MMLSAVMRQLHGLQEQTLMVSLPVVLPLRRRTARVLVTVLPTWFTTLLPVVILLTDRNASDLNTEGLAPLCL